MGGRRSHALKHHGRPRPRPHGVERPNPAATPADWHTGLTQRLSVAMLTSPTAATGRGSFAPSTATILLLLATQVFAHPSAIGGGRGSCGAEYDTPETAYYLPDISESWYLRRIATCDKPVFWQRLVARLVLRAWTWYTR